jgi:peptide/nickel transport system permease protein
MAYVRRKVLFYLVAVWAAVTLNFVIPRLAPGSPVDVLLARLQQNGAVPPRSRRALELMLGYHGGQNIFRQYLSYLGNTARGDFGISVTSFPTPVSTILRQALPWTLALVGMATLLSFGLGIALGTIAGWRRGSWVDGLVPTTTFLAAIPYFWLGLVLVFLFGSTWKLLPTSGGYSFDTGIGFNGPFLASALYHGLLPAGTIVISSVGGWLLGMRNMMVSTLAEDYVVTAEAKGLPRRRIMVTYAARNAILPSVAGFATSLGFVVSGSIVAEAVFSYPGIGFTLLQAVQNKDYALMQAIFLVITLAVLGANFCVDMLYAVIDPRTRQSR